MVVDDGSIDHTFQVANTIANAEPRVKLFSIEHSGISKAKNFACSKANSEIIALQDADDYSLPNRAEKIITHIRGYDILVHSLYINSWSERFGCIERRYLGVERPDKHKILETQYLPGVPAFRKKIWQKKPFREETRFAIDYMMWVDWILSEFNIIALDEGLYEYVRYSGSASDRYARDGRRAQSFEKIKQIIHEEYQS